MWRAEDTVIFPGKTIFEPRLFPPAFVILQQGSEHSSDFAE